MGSERLAVEVDFPEPTYPLVGGVRTPAIRGRDEGRESSRIYSEVC